MYYKHIYVVFYSQTNKTFSFHLQLTPEMPHFVFSITALLSLIYIVYCNPILPESSHKADSNPSIGDVEPLSEQADQLIEVPLSDEEQEKRDWNKLAGVWGKRGWNNLSNMWGKRETTSDLPPYWGKRGWNNLSNVWGKRGWNNLSNVWGKRDWNKLSNVWGKRDWNKLSNVWGKRDWNKLSNVWGKRSSNRDDGSKRTTNWNKLNSLWGKRDADSEMPPIWERTPSEDGKVN